MIDSDLNKRISDLEEKVHDLLWRMNSVCNVLHQELGPCVNDQKPKFSVGQKLWFIDCGTNITQPLFDIKCLCCSSIEYISGNIVYILDGEIQFPESQVFATKMDLIVHQCQFWMKQEDDLIKLMHEINNDKP